MSLATYPVRNSSDPVGHGARHGAVALRAEVEQESTLCQLRKKFVASGSLPGRLNASSGGIDRSSAGWPQRASSESIAPRAHAGHCIRGLTSRPSPRRVRLRVEAKRGIVSPQMEQALDMASVQGPKLHQIVPDSVSHHRLERVAPFTYTEGTTRPSWYTRSPNGSRPTRPKIVRARAAGGTIG